MFEDLNDLYQQVILDHCKKPRNFHEMPLANRTAQGHNPLCGDNLKLFLTLDGEVVKDASTQEWTSRLTLGDTNAGMSLLYHVKIVLLDTELADYLTHSRPEANATWWTSETLPPKARTVSAFDLRRDSKPAMGVC